MRKQVIAFRETLGALALLGSLAACNVQERGDLVPEQQALAMVQQEIPIAAKICMREMFSFGSARAALEQRGYFRRYFPGRKLTTYIKDAPPHHPTKANHDVTVATRERATLYECEFWGRSEEKAAYEVAIKRELANNGFKQTGKHPSLPLVMYSNGSKTVRLFEGTDLETSF
jgi:hypothetical protein